MYILIDIGGTKIRMAVSYDGENLEEFETFVTPFDFPSAQKLIGQYVAKFDSSQNKRVVCCGLPGVLNKDKTVLITAPNLPNWTQKQIKKGLSEQLNAVVYLENDTALAGLGEAVSGVGKGYSIVAYLAFGTGVGGVRIVDGEADKSALGFEPGHQIIDADGSIVGRLTDWEGLVGGAGIEARFGQRPENIKDKKIWQSVEKYIAVGLTNTILHWSPEVVILGGSVIKSNFLSLDRISSSVSGLLKVFPLIPEILIGSLGDEAALLGGLHYLKKV